jgi:hypothetical protein
VKLKPTDLSDFRRRRAREQGKPKPARVPFERHEPIKIPLRAEGSRPERADIILDVHGMGHVLDARQALELGKALIRACGELAVEGA